mmetsp:Transcript_17296/g.44911  ORF Transcript_17296/g.44911 Transcript_17296/m.44911 type:complete len:207 (+) Transcript_17296:969-1589(+)
MRHPAQRSPLSGSRVGVFLPTRQLPPVSQALHAMVSVVRSQLSLWSAGGLYCRGRGRCCVASSDGGPAGRKVSTSGSSTNESVGDRSCWGRQLVLRLMLKDCRRRLPCLPVCLVRCSGPPLWLWRPPIPASSAEMASRHGALDRTRLCMAPAGLRSETLCCPAMLRSEKPTASWACCAPRSKCGSLQLSYRSARSRRCWDCALGAH